MRFITSEKVSEWLPEALNTFQITVTSGVVLHPMFGLRYFMRLDDSLRSHNGDSPGMKEAVSFGQGMSPTNHTVKVVNRT